MLLKEQYNSCVYYGNINSRGVMYLLLYVDDILIIGGSSSHIERLKNLLKGEFETKDLSNAKRILGMDIHKDRVAGTLFISQERYATRY